ncbi:VMAP-C domain-containing protein [Nonomuraea sediminis]|uniref:VMAP-C domain-containing protein n=1 Tax=Nonomuraea sediminis TaxID=2835864 RepID=UPI001BDD0ABE|nr:trypsin-like peptidase domain-containing protein [Nonomuraea sediminis]
MAGPDVPWLARLLDAEGFVTGLGFLISDQMVLTCTHIVAGAAGTRSTAERPAGSVRVQFPALDTERQAEVLAGGWVPAGSGSGDLAVLTLLGPAIRCDPLPRLGRGAAPGMRVTSPPVLPVVSVLDAPQGGEDWEWLRMPATSDFPGRIGGPVIDTATGAVVGMITARGLSEAWMLPVERMAEYWPPLLDHLEERPAAEPGRARELGRLVDALLELPDIRSPEVRSLYVRLLGEAIGTPPLIARHASPRADLWSLVTWCRSQPGGLHELLDVARFMVADSVDVEALAARVEQLEAPPLLTVSERRELLALLAPVPQAELRKAYEQASGRPAPSDGGPRALVAALEELVADPGTAPPLAAFAGPLAARDDRLRAWQDAFTSRLAVPAVPEEPRRRVARPSHLTIQVDGDLLDPGLFRVSAWLSGEEAEPVVTLVRGDDALPLEGVAEAAGRLVEEVHAEGELVIEFIVPRRLLTWHVEELSTPDGERLGHRYPVVRRSGRGWTDRRSATASPEVRLVEGDETELRRAVSSGVPVVVWAREADQDVRDLVAHTDPAELPRAVRDLRRSSPPDRRIAVLWDDPERPPVQPPLLMAPDSQEATP